MCESISVYLHDMADMKYLELLSRSFPTIADASTEIVNLSAILHLPKGTEHFLADIHGEHEAFLHVLKNASGNIRRKVEELFGSTLREAEMRQLCTLIYYPEEKLSLVKAGEKDMREWYQITLLRLVAVCREISSKYTRSKVRKALPEEFSYIIQELLQESTSDTNKAAYVNAIIDSIIDTGRADDIIVAVSNVIQRLAIDRLHILGDIFDRGPGAHIILDTLTDYHKWDIQWGNHDILWMGAAAGNDACICNVLRISLRYANLTTLEEGYGINLVPLTTFAMETYGDDPCSEFEPMPLRNPSAMDEKSRHLTAMMHKAIAVIQFKVEDALFRKHPEWGMEGRCLLGRIDYANGRLALDGKTCEMTSCHFPTIDPSDPDKLSPAEVELLQKLRHSFMVSEKLHGHIRLMLRHGSLYGTYNGNLLFHASIPLNEDGTLRDVTVRGESLHGKELLQTIGKMIREAFQKDAPEEDRRYDTDYFLYLWCGPDSPLFDKSKMATLERYFLTDKDTWHEENGWYFKYRDNPEVVDGILDSFGVRGQNRHIINGHVPVHVRSGENPVKAGGRLLVIDGGFSEPYHKETGIAGYTLVYHSRSLELVQHEPFTSTSDAIVREIDVKGTTHLVELKAHRVLVEDTDKGEELRGQIRDLQALLEAYRSGLIAEK